MVACTFVGRELTQDQQTRLQSVHNSADAHVLRDTPDTVARREMFLATCRNHVRVLSHLAAERDSGRQPSEPVCS